jgi:hypothetical protein
MAMATVVLSTGLVAFSAPSSGAAPAVDGYFNEVACPSATSCFAVGAKFPAGSGGATLIEHWNGTGWSAMASPNANTSPNGGTALAGDSCPTTTFCVAVGYSSVNFVHKVFITRWNGTTWSIVSAPTPAGEMSDLYAVSCATATSCFAVGQNRVTSTSIRPLTERWNGTSWSIVANPNPPGATTSALYGVTCRSASFCFAVGASGNGAGPQAFIERWNGTKWTITKVLNPVAGALPWLFSVSCPTDKFCFAVGQIEAGSGTRSWTVLWQGTSWHTVASRDPSKASDSSFSAVTCSTTSACFAVGRAMYGFSGPMHSFINRWDGVHWTRSASVDPDPSSTSLSGVACRSKSNCFAVGSRGSGTVIERWNGTDWALSPHPQPTA